MQAAVGSNARAVTPAQIAGTQAGSPTAVWRAAKAAREELKNQLESLEDRRGSLANQLRSDGPAGTDKAGIEARIVEVDKRITDVEKQVATAEANVANAAAVPGAVVEPPRYERHGPPEEVFVLGGLFIVVCLLPLSIAYARRIWRRGSAAVVSFPTELSDRLNRLDHAVDSIAVEVERISEGQRFVTRVMTDNGRGLSAGAAQPVHAGVPAEKVRVGRKKGRSLRLAQSNAHDRSSTRGATSAPIRSGEHSTVGVRILHRSARS